MKKLYTFLLLAATGYTFAQPALPIYEPFSYAEASNLGGQGGWANMNTGDEVVVAGGNLSYSGLQASTGNSVIFSANGIDPQLTIADQTSGIVYASFIFRVNDLSTLTIPEGGYFFGLAASSTTFASTVWVKPAGAGFNIGINKATAVADTQYLPAEFALNTDYFVVVSYNLGDVKSSSIWVNPLPATLGQDTAPSADINSTTRTTDRTNIQIVFIRQDSTTETPGIVMDEVRVGTTWASVTPAGPLAVNQNSISGFSVYPNPVTNGQLFVTSNSNTPKSVVIYDVVGKVVAKATVTSQSMNVSNLNGGVYIVKITEDGKTATRKLVIK